MSIVHGPLSGWGTLGTSRHVFTFAFRARSKEHRIDIESEDPKGGAARY